MVLWRQPIVRFFRLLSPRHSGSAGNILCIWMHHTSKSGGLSTCVYRAQQIRQRWYPCTHLRSHTHPVNKNWERQEREIVFFSNAKLSRLRICILLNVPVEQRNCPQQFKSLTYSINPKTFAEHLIYSAPLAVMNAAQYLLQRIGGTANGVSAAVIETCQPRFRRMS